jgi:GlpG protein
MRLIGTIDTPELTRRFAGWLSSQGIPFQTESAISKDWGSDAYGTPVTEIWIWIVNEEDFPRAVESLNAFLENPSSPLFDKTASVAPPQFNRPTPTKQTIRQKLQEVKTSSQAPIGKGTLAIILLCSLLFGWGTMTTPQYRQVPTQVPLTALLSSPVYEELMYDWPAAYATIRKAAALYGPERLASPDLPQEGKYLVHQYLNTPYWQGVYPLVVDYLRPPAKQTPVGPLFEKISEGEVWRLFTPIFLHANIFHILFNMLWILVLGRQMEERVGIPRYFLFILIAAAFSNTAQYLMSGPDFVGISGVIVAMLTFIWTRQKIAPWEGYQLQQGTFLFLSTFILAMFLLQVVLFAVEISTGHFFNFPIANTAHLAGGAIGFALGTLPLFSWKKNDRS